MAQNNSCNYRPTQYNVQTGGASGALNDVAPSATSGVPLISQGSSSQPTFGTAVVAGGGTGVASFTAYSLIAAGTTGTGTMQSVGTGSSGQIIRSGGSSALPSWSTATYPSTAGTSGNVLTSDGTNWTSSAPAAGSSYALTMMTSSGLSNPADATTYFLAFALAVTTSTASGGDRQQLVIPKTGTLNVCYGICRVAGTLGSAQNCTLAIRLNNTTDTTVTSSLATSSAQNTFSATSLGISVTAGDYIEFKLTTPTWTTNPTTVGFTITVYIS